MLSTISKLSIALTVSARMLQSQDEDLTCWKKAVGRGAGEIPSSCPEGQEADGLLCYDECKSGYSGVGPICWQDCESGFRDDGLYCAKTKSYWRSWYSNCRSGFTTMGLYCDQNCPSGMYDIGVSCQKNHYDRGLGSPMQCDDDQEQDGLLCYPKCENGADGEGPVCWGQCPAGTEECGAICLGEGQVCADYVEQTAGSAIDLATSIAAHNVFGIVIHTVELVDHLDHPECPNW